MRFDGQRIGVLGAGSMGTGIAELAAGRGFEVVIVDADPAALERSRAHTESRLRRSVERGRLDRTSADELRSHLSRTTELDRLAGCDAVIEAVSERLELKRDLFATLAAICPSSTLLATNTSSLRVSAIAAGVENPERVVGMHFFNPATQMKLLEVVAGLESGEDHVRRAVDLGEQLGKTVIKAKDGIGFLVNRTARPFVGEALRLVQEGIATVAQVDRICRMGGGFRMGPFELVDLIGVDVNLEIGESFWFQSYGEPRWRPSPIQAQMVGAGRLGRKSGVGFYDYSQGGPPADPTPPAPARGAERVVAIGGLGHVAQFLRSAATRQGFRVCDWNDRDAGSAWLAVDADPRRRLGSERTQSVAARTVLCAASSLGQRPSKACGFHLLGPAEESRLVEVSRIAESAPLSVERSRDFFASLGLHVEETGDSPGMVLGRIVGQLVNEAAFSLEEGVADASDIDAGAKLGLNYPRGPVEWAQAAGLDQIRATLSALVERRQEERYRLSPLLLDAQDDLRDAVRATSG